MTPIADYSQTNEQKRLNDARGGVPAAIPEAEAPYSNPG